MKLADGYRGEVVFLKLRHAWEAIIGQPLPGGPRWPSECAEPVPAGATPPPPFVPGDQIKLCGADGKTQTFTVTSIEATGDWPEASA